MQGEKKIWLNITQLGPQINKRRGKGGREREGREGKGGREG